MTPCRRRASQHRAGGTPASTAPEARQMTPCRRRASQHRAGGTPDDTVGLRRPPPFPDERDSGLSTTDAETLPPGLTSRQTARCPRRHHIPMPLRSACQWASFRGCSPKMPLSASGHGRRWYSCCCSGLRNQRRLSGTADAAFRHVTFREPDLREHGKCPPGPDLRPDSGDVHLAVVAVGWRTAAMCRLLSLERGREQTAADHRGSTTSPGRRRCPCGRPTS